MNIIRYGCKCLGRVALVLALITPGELSSQTSNNLEETVEKLVNRVSENAAAQSFYIQLGPNAAPIVTRKLLEVLSQGSSVEGAQAQTIIKMPQEDQTRVYHLRGLLTMQSLSLTEMSLGVEVRRSALDSLEQATKSAYRSVRNDAIYFLALGGGRGAVEKILPLLDDSDEANRDQAAEMLEKIGDRSTADKVEAILKRRAQGKSLDQVQKDRSIQHGLETVAKLRKKD